MVALQATLEALGDAECLQHADTSDLDTATKWLTSTKASSPATRALVSYLSAKGHLAVLGTRLEPVIHYKKPLY